MGIIYTDAERQQIASHAQGKVIDLLEWVEKDRYWVITFTDGSEVCVRLMAEIETHDPSKLMKYMTEPELAEHMNHQLRFIRNCQTPDTIGSMLIIFQADGILQYGATIDPETAPQALRELADRIEKRETVKRGW